MISLTEDDTLRILFLYVKGRHIIVNVPAPIPDLRVQIYAEDVTPAAGSSPITLVRAVRQHDGATVEGADELYLAAERVFPKRRPAER